MEILLQRMKYTHEIVDTHGGALLPEHAPGARSGSKIPLCIGLLAAKDQISSSYAYTRRLRRKFLAVYPKSFKAICHSSLQLKNVQNGKTSFGLAVPQESKASTICSSILWQQEVKEDQQSLLSRAQNSMKAVLGVQKVFVALQVQKDLQFQFFVA